MDQLTDYVNLRKGIVERIITRPNFYNNVAALLKSPTDATEYSNTKAKIKSEFLSGIELAPQDFFDQMFIVRPDGTVILATDDQWIKLNFGSEKIQNQAIHDLIGTNKEVFAYSPVSSYTNSMALFISRSFRDEKGTITATLFTISNSSPLASTRTF
jgi:hypothetical protein